MYKVPSYFGEIPAEVVEQVSKAMSDYDRYMTEFQHREEKPEAEEPAHNMVRGPRLKSYTITRIK